MPKPLIILDHHFVSASKDFLSSHLGELKALGYKKILFEMNIETSFSDFKRQIHAMAKIPGRNHSVNQLISSLVRLLDAIEAHGLSCEFIDPEPLAIAESFNSALTGAKTQAEFERIMVLRQRATDERDVYMAKRVMDESERLSGAVITFVGFKHTELLRRLRVAGLEHVAVVVDDSRGHRLDVRGAEHREWFLMSDPSYRMSHYGQAVHYLDWEKAHLTPFFALKAELGLAQVSDCSYRPLVARVLDSAAELKIDESHHVHAYLALTKQAEIESVFPGLRFFKTEDKLCIPGINLPAQQEKIVRL